MLSHPIGVDGVWIDYPVAFVVSLALQAIYDAAVWRKRRHGRLV